MRFRYLFLQFITEGYRHGSIETRFAFSDERSEGYVEPARWVCVPLLPTGEGICIINTAKVNNL